MTQTLRLVLLREIPEDAHLRQQWDALVKRVDQPQVFYTYEWALAVQRAYSKTLHPLLFLGFDDEESLCGVAALAVTSEENMVSFLCATTGDYCDFLSLPENKQAFVAAVLTDLRKQALNSVTLTNLPADSGTLAAIRTSSAQNGYRCFARTAYVCAQVEMAKLERSPVGNKPILLRKKMLRRCLNAMGQKAPLRLDHARSWETAEPILQQFMRSHVARFLATGRISNIAHPQRRLFLEELAKLLGESGWFALTQMISGETAFAWNYGFQFEGTWFWYQPTFDSEMEKYSPGFCLLAKMIEEASDNPTVKTLDLGLGAEEYKDRFTNQSRETLYVTLNVLSSRHLREILRYGLSAAVKRWPAAERAIRALSARLGALQQRVRGMGVGGTGTWIVKRVKSAISSTDEVYFYELTNPNPDLLRSDGVHLMRIDLDTLATAAMQNADDKGTLAYLLRCTHRLRTEPESSGFALTNADGDLLHFTWAGPFENFYWSELGSMLPEPVPGSVVLFDSWTPVSQRGRGHYGPTLALVVARIRQEGKRSWGFSASTNTPSVRGLEKAGFRRSFSVFRYHRLLVAEDSSSERRDAARRLRLVHRNASSSPSSRRFPATRAMGRSDVGPRRRFGKVLELFR